jgi:hypothetical protein
MCADASERMHRWPASIPTRTIRDCISAAKLLFCSHGRVVNSRWSSTLTAALLWA